MKKSSPFPINAMLLLGPTGAGKSPLGDVLAEKGLFGRKCRHLDFGSELRQAVSGGNRSVLYSPAELDFINGVLNHGLLLENEHFILAQKIISLFLVRSGFSQSDFLVLNGIPRHDGQARDLAGIVQMRALVVLDCSEEEIAARIGSNVGGDRADRTDDQTELIGKKLRIFRERTEPMIERYRKEECRIYRIPVSATTTPGDAYAALSALAAVDPPVALIAEPPEG